MNNAEMNEEDITMDFFEGLDDTRYGEFKTSYLNDPTMGAPAAPKHVNEIYTKAPTYLTPKRALRTGGGAAFVSKSSTCSKEEAAHMLGLR